MGCLTSMILRSICGFIGAAIAAGACILLFGELPDAVKTCITGIGFVLGFYVPGKRNRK